jgi:TP901 family phage tail tape measure protein
MIMLGVTLKLFDQMTGGLKSATRQVDGLRGRLQALSDTAARFGREQMASGLVAGGALMKSVSAFANLEDASTRLKVTMMDKNGLVGAFGEINALAVSLGNRLPGTTADFQNMMATLKQFGITDQSILGGVGEATANIGVLLKMAPEAAAEFVAKLKEATGTADSDMLAFMDTIQRLAHLGVSSTEMMYSFARSAGALKQVKVQGLEATQQMSALYAILIKTGASGETVGTASGTILNALLDKKKLADANAELRRFGISLQFADKQGNFLGVENMVAQFDKLKKLDPAAMNEVLKGLFGGGQDQQMVATLISSGMEGYRKMLADMERQADLQRRVREQLGTLMNLWDAASGTFTNTLAAFSKAMAPELKALTEWFGNLSESVGAFIEAHPTLAKWLGLAALAFVGLSLGLGAAGLALAGFLKYVALVLPVIRVLGVAWAVGMKFLEFKLLLPVFSMLAGGILKVQGALAVLATVARAHPVLLALTLIAAAAIAIYQNWDKVKSFFTGFFGWLEGKASKAAEWLKSMVPDWVVKTFGGSPSMASPIARPQLAPALPSASRAQDARVGGEIRVKIDSEGRPKQVQATTTNPNVPVRADVGHAMAW